MKYPFQSLNGGRKPVAGVVAALDFGTAKATCLIARVDAQGQVRILGNATQASRGMRNAAVVDIDEAGHTVGSVVQAAEVAAKQKIDSVLVNVSAGHVVSERAYAKVPLHDRPIGSAEVCEALAIARGQAPREGRAMLHFVPLGYSVDGVKGVRDPRGLFGNTLGLESLLITVRESALRSLHTAVGRAHLEVEEAIVSAYAAGLAVLHPDERDLGVTLIDLGAGSTNVAVFSEGEPVFCESIPIGGAHITSDIARGLSTPLIYAERLKTLHGSCLPSASDERDLIDLQPIGDDDDGESLHAPRALLVRIITARMEEIFELLRRSIDSPEVERLAGGAVVLTGGGSQLHGITELATHVLDKRARIGRPGGVLGLVDMIDSPDHATAVGMLLHARQRMMGGLGNAVLDLERMPGMFSRLGSMLKLNR
jgi:cell division protein FtsA